MCSNPATLIKQKPRTLSGTGADALRVDDGSRKFYCAVKDLGIMSCKNKVTNERQNLAFCFDYSIKNSLLSNTQASALGIP